MSLPVTLGGASAEALEFEGEDLSCSSERPFAPGQPVAVELTLADGSPLSLSGKCRGSKRRDDGRFDVRLRLVSLRRAEREALATAMDRSAPPG